ncbi:MAG: beta-propeller domain-containing protein, partial [Acidimicrobiia bacterium]
MRPTRRPLSLAIALSLAAVLGACSSADGDTATGSGTGDGGRAGTGGGALASLQLASALQPFSSCDALLEHLKTEATARVTPYGLPGMGYGGYRYGVPEAALSAETGAFPTTVAASAPVAAVEDSAGSGDAKSSSETPAYSGTNTVEKDIDEGDLVKTDGTHLYLIDSSTGTLRVVAANGGQPVEAASLSLPGYPSQLVRVGSTLLVTGSPDETVTGRLDQAASKGAEIMPVWTSPRSVVWEVDVSDAANPRLVRQLVLDGSVASIRMTGDVARIVVQTPPEDLGFVQPSNPAGEQRALEANKDVIAGSTIDDWLGAYHLLDADGEELSSGRLTGCDAVGRPADFHGFSLTSVLSVDVTKGLSDPNAAGVLADSQQVYASAEHLYVAIGAWQDPIILP